MAKDRWKCDVCGRYTTQDGHFVNQGGDMACDECRKWAEYYNLTCPNCKGDMIRGSYEKKCSCNHKVTRTGRRFQGV